MPKLYVDADACPVKTEAIRVAQRHGVELFMVSNSGSRAAVGPGLHSILVGQEFDAADNWIAERIGPGDVAITADIQLAARCLEQGASVLGPAGRPFTKESIGSALAMRELSAYLREAGEISGHNASFSKQDRSNFLNALELLLRRA